MRYLKLFLLVIINILFASHNSYSEFTVSNWKTYSSLIDVNCVTVDSKGNIWAGTSGGVFVYDKNNDNIIEYRNIDALLSLEVTAINFNKTDNSIYIGCSDGVIDIVTEDNHFTHITDIRNSGFSNPIINDIVFKDSLAYIVGGFGLTIFDIKNKVFVYTADRLGKFPQYTPVNQILFEGNQIWLATKVGIAKANLNSYLPDPQSWTNYTKDNGLPDNFVSSIVFYQGSLYVANNNYISKMVNDTFSILKSYESWENITKLHIYNDKIYLSTAYSIKSIENEVIDVKHPILSDNLTFINGFITNSYDDNKSLVVYYKENGISTVVNNDIHIIRPNSPSSNLFSDLAFDSKGNLWVATGKEPGGKGFMKMKNGYWNNFSYAANPEIRTNAYLRVNALSNGDIVYSTWGRGFNIVKEVDTGFVFEFYNNKNSPLVDLTTNPDYVITGDAALDRSGKMWIVNFGKTSPGPILISAKKSNDVYEFNSFYNCSSPNHRFFLPLAIDFNGTKWLGADNEDPKGLVYYNEKSTLSDNSDDICGILTESNSSLPENAQNSIVVDKNGYVWIGTPEGLAVILNPSSVLSNKIPVIRKVNLISSLPVYDILVDALNNKWIATNEGVWVIDPDGIEVLANYTTNNSPLISNEVKSLTTDVTTGKVFIGTLKGLSEVTSIAIQPLESYDIKCYPQPFNPSKDEQLIIEGLGTDSEIKILTVNGEFVKSISSTGRIAIWDGKDEDGNNVSSGIYIISASSTTTDAAGLGKIAVIR